MIDPTLLQTFATNPDAARELFQATLAERAAADPQLATLMQMFAQRSEAADDPAPTVNVVQRDRVRRVRDRVQEMRAELITLRERCGYLADALGACARCWGSDDDCDECGGEGAPGSREPNPELFRELVEPAAARRAARAPKIPTHEE